MKSVLFSDVALGGWFKETATSCWHLKTSSTTGMYSDFGTRYEPRFKADEIVFVD